MILLTYTITIRTVNKSSNAKYLARMFSVRILEELLEWSLSCLVITNGIKQKILDAWAQWRAHKSNKRLFTLSTSLSTSNKFNMWRKSCQLSEHLAACSCLVITTNHSEFHHRMFSTVQWYVMFLFCYTFDSSDMLNVLFTVKLSPEALYFSFAELEFVNSRI
jgi:hypothetical protein